jgi:hypothetical protein
MTSLQQTAMLVGAASAKTASYTLVAADAGTAISMSNASATTITVNTALFAAGDTVQITNLGAGVCTITAGTATVNTSASLALAQYESGTLDFTSASAAVFIKGAGGSGGGMTLLSTTTLSGASTTVTVSSTGYIRLMIDVTGVTNATGDGGFYLKPNNESNQGFYTGVRNILNTPAMLNYNADLITLTDSVVILRTNAVNRWTVIIDYPEDTYHPIQLYGKFTNDGGNNVEMNFAGATMNAAITSLVFSNTGGSFSTGTVKVYGVK